MAMDCILTCTAQMGHLSTAEQRISIISACKAFTWIYEFERNVEWGHEVKPHLGSLFQSRGIVFFSFIIFVYMDLNDFFVDKGIYEYNLHFSYISKWSDKFFRKLLVILRCVDFSGPIGYPWQWQWLGCDLGTDTLKVVPPGRCRDTRQGWCESFFVKMIQLHQKSRWVC